MNRKAESVRYLAKNLRIYLLFRQVQIHEQTPNKFTANVRELTNLSIGTATDTNSTELG